MKQSHRASNTRSRFLMSIFATRERIGLYCSAFARFMLSSGESIYHSLKAIISQNRGISAPFKAIIVIVLMTLIASSIKETL
jgi:hypothetical protein